MQSGPFVFMDDAGADCQTCVIWKKKNSTLLLVSTQTRHLLLSVFRMALEERLLFDSSRRIGPSSTSSDCFAVPVTCAAHDSLSKLSIAIDGCTFCESDIIEVSVLSRSADPVSCLNTLLLKHCCQHMSWEDLEKSLASDLSKVAFTTVFWSSMAIIQYRINSFVLQGS